MICPQCNTEIPDGAALCPGCVTIIEDDDSQEEDGSDPSWMERAAESALQWLSDDVEEVLSWVQTQRSTHPGVSAEALAWRAIRQARFWSGNAGFVAGLGDFLGPWGFASGTAADIGIAAKLSIQMAQRIYAAYGYDIADDQIKLRIMSALGAGTAGAGRAAGGGATRVGKRLAEKYLRGALLKAIKAFFRRLGIVFTRKALVAWMPVLGSGVNFAVNRWLMTELGKQVLGSVQSP